MQNLVDTLDGSAEDTPPVHFCSLANNVSPEPPRQDPIEPPAESFEGAVLTVPAPTPALAHPQRPRSPREMAESSQEELQKAAAILLKHDAAVFSSLCARCQPLLQQLLAKLALFDNVIDSQSESEEEDPSTDISGNEADSENVPSSRPAAVNDACIAGDTASSGVILGNERHEGDTVPSVAKLRLWSEEQSSGSELEDELRNSPENHEAGGPEATQVPSTAAPNPADIGVSETAALGSPSIADIGRTPAFDGRKDTPNFALANATLPSPKRVRDDEEESSSVSSSTPTEHPSAQNDVQVDLQRPAVRRSRLEQEADRLQALVRKKDFKCFERIRGRPVNVVEGLELHEKVVNQKEMRRLIDMVYKFQEMGRKGLLRERTYSEPRKWMPGKGRVTMQFGCCYNYAQDRNGNPPGIMREAIVDEIPDLLKAIIRRLVKWAVLPETCVPDSCIINIYDVGDCIPPHIDHHDFVRPFSTLSLLSECNILFGSKLSIVGDGKFDGPMSIPLPVGSVLVLQGNGADIAKHAVPGVPTKRISITFRKMDPAKVPRGYELPKDLRGIRTAPHLR